MIFSINGDIIPSDYQDMYDWYGFEATSPKSLKAALDSLPVGDRLEVKINSPGGDFNAGQEMYSIIRQRNDVDIEVVGIAASAASIIALAGPSSISPVGLVMIHDAATAIYGNKNDLKDMAKTLDKIDTAIAQAYADKTGKAIDDLKAMMDKTCWLTAQDAVDIGLIDKISEPAASGQAAAAIGGLKVTPDMVAKYRQHVADEQEELRALTADLDSYGKE